MPKLGEKIVVENNEYLVILVDADEAGSVLIIDFAGRIYKFDGEKKCGRLVDLSDIL